MLMMMFTGLNGKTKRFIKNMVLLHASDILRACRIVYRKIKLDVSDDSILSDLKAIDLVTFTRRCTETLNGSRAKVGYVKRMIKCHVLPVINHVFSVYRNRLSALDTENIINSTVPRFFYSNRIRELDTLRDDINGKIVLILYIKS